MTLPASERAPPSAAVWTAPLAAVSEQTRGQGDGFWLAKQSFLVTFTPDYAIPTS